MKIDVTEQEFAYLLNVLAARPYGEIFQLIAKLQAQKGLPESA